MKTRPDSRGLNPRTRNPLAGFRSRRSRAFPREPVVVTAADEARVEALLAAQRQSKAPVIPVTFNPSEQQELARGIEAVTLEEVEKLTAPNPEPELRRLPEKRTATRVPWHRGEEKRLLQRWNVQRLTLHEIAVLHDRSADAIRLRLVALNAWERF